MKLIKTVQSIIRKSLGLSGWDSLFEAFGISTGDTINEVSRPYSQVVWAHRCIDFLAKAVAATPIKITDKNDREVKSGPIVDFCKQPSTDYGMSRFLYETAGYYTLTGEANWLVMDYGRNLEPKDVLVAGRDQMTPLVAGYAIKYWQINLLSGRSLTMLPQDVIQNKQWNPYSAWRGLSKLDVAALELNQSRKASLFNNAMLDNNIAVPGIMTAPEITAEQEAQIRAGLAERNQGYRNAFKPLILKGGLTWVDSVKDISRMQHLELSKFTREAICVTLDTPLPLLGVMDQAQLDNLKGSQKIWLYGAYIPTCEWISQKLTECFAQKFGDYYIWLNTMSHPIYQEILRDSIAAGKQLFDMTVPFADVNTFLNLGLPEREWYKIGWKPIGLVRWDDQADLGPSLPEGESQESPDSQPGQESPKSLTVSTSPTSETSLTAMTSSAIEIVKTKIWESWAKSIGPLEKKFGKTMKTYFNRQRRDLLERLEKVHGLQATDYSQKADAPSADDIIKFIFDVNSENQKLLATVKPLLAEASAFGASQANHELGLAGVFGVNDPLSQKLMRRRLPKLVSLNRTTKERVKTSIAEGLKNGDTVADIAKRIREDHAFSGSRAMMTARTETAGAVTQGRFEGFKEAGVQYKSWLSARSGEVRPAHAAADAKYTKDPIPMTEPFIVDGEELQHPGDRAGSAGNVINCRCCLLPVAKKKAIQYQAIKDYSERNFLTLGAWEQKLFKAN